MTAKPLRCVFGLHSYVAAHPTDERRRPGPDDKVCRRCGKQQKDLFGIPPGVIG
jgi:hypothetical protein